MTFDQFFRIIKARWILMVAVLLSIVTLTMLISFVMPKTYVANAAVMADSRPDPVSALQSAGMQPLNFISTQVDVIESGNVGQRVVTMLKLGEGDAMKQRWVNQTGGKGDFTAWLAEIIGKGLTVKPSRESNVIGISYEGADPAFAANVANAYARAYIESTVQMRVDPARQFAGFFEERLSLARKNLEEAQTKLSQASRDKGIVVTDERLDVESGRLNEMATQVNMIRAARVETSTRYSESRINADDMPEVLGSSTITSLKADQSRLEAKLSEIGTAYGEKHPQVVELKANLDTVRSRLRKEISSIVAGGRINASVNTTREAEAVKSFEDQRTRVLKLKEARNTLQVLEQDVAYAQRVYDSIQGRLGQTTLESSSLQSGIYLLSAATEPASAATPKIMLNFILSLVMGTLVSLLVILAVELFDHRVRGATDLSQILNLAVVGVLPSLTEGRKRLFGKPRVLFGAASHSPALVTKS